MHGIDVLKRLGFAGVIDSKDQFILKCSGNVTRASPTLRSVKDLQTKKIYRNFLVQVLLVL